MGTRKRIKRNQVNFGRPMSDQLRESAGVIKGVIDSVQHDVLERHLLLGVVSDIIPTGREQVVDGIAPVEWYELTPKFVVRRVQRHRKANWTAIA